MDQSSKKDLIIADEPKSEIVQSLSSLNQSGKNLTNNFKSTVDLQKVDQITVDRKASGEIPFENSDHESSLVKIMPV